MSRLHFGLLLIACTFAILFMGSAPNTESQPAWEPRSGIEFIHRRKSSLEASDFHVDTRGTLKKWGASGRALQSRPAILRPGHVLGVLLTSLQLPDYNEPVSTTLQAGGCATSVVQNGEPQKPNCSVLFTGPNPINGGCSVSWASNQNPMGTPNCSSTGGGGGSGGGSGPCSAGQNSPNPLQPTTLCSASGGVNQPGAGIACSAANSGDNTGAQCSAVQGPGNPAAGSTCSVGVAGVNATCSTGGQAAPNGVGGTCSTTAPPKVNGSGGANVCSVKSGAVGSSCSSTGAGETCSAGGNTGNNNDFCSVEPDAVKTNTCTTFGGGACSAFGRRGGAPMQCEGPGPTARWPLQEPLAIKRSAIRRRLDPTRCGLPT